MPTAEGRVPTPRADRYLDQLCGHLGHLPHGHGGSPDHAGQPGHAGPPAVRRIDRTGSGGHIEFDWGTCDLTATETDLVLTVTADDADALERGQRLLAQRIETIGRRDDLAVTWTPRPAPSAP